MCLRERGTVWGWERGLRVCMHVGMVCVCACVRACMCVCVCMHVCVEEATVEEELSKKAIHPAVRAQL